MYGLEENRVLDDRGPARRTTCTRRRLFVQVESPPLEVGEHYGVYEN